MKSVQLDECAQGDYTATSSAAAVTLKKDDETFTTYPTDTDFKYKVFRLMSFKNTVPAVFGLLNYQTTTQYYDSKGNVVTTPAVKKTAYTIAPATATEQLSDNYADSSYPNRVYCLVTSAERGTNAFRRYSPVFTDILQAGNAGAANLECMTGSDSPTVEVGTANKERFLPATELTNPESNQ